MIELENVTYSYPQSSSPALDRASMRVGPGELLLIAGDSGSGKSTLVRSMTGLVPHFHGGRFSGRVSVAGKDTKTCNPRDLADRVGFVAQDPESQAVASRVENDIAFTLENLGLPPSTMRKRVEEILDALSISGLRNRKIDTLSGGERQRVAIASALAAMPQALVLDEPTSQLDPQSAEEVLSALLRLRDELGISIVLAEHRLERVLEYSDRVALVSAGFVVAENTRAGAARLFSNTEVGPPVLRVGIELGWSPLPLSIRQARNFSSKMDMHPTNKSDFVSGNPIGTTSGVSVSFNGTDALKRVDLTIHEGEVVALMGRNGSGKTTLLRALAGLVPERNLRGGVLRPRGIAMVPQNPSSILFRRTVRQELATTLAGRRSERTIEQEADKFSLLPWIDADPRDLSGGERTKVAIGAACAGDPDLILLDEPTRGMDNPAKRHLADLASEWSRSGKSVIIATHDVELAAIAATRVVLMSEGEVIVDGPPQSVLANSLTFSTQMNKVFGDERILTVTDALEALR